MKRNNMYRLGILLTFSFQLFSCAGQSVNVTTYKFDGNGGTLISGREEQSVTDVSFLVRPTYERYGYTFVGWITEVNKDGTINLKADWEPKSYTLTFMSRNTVISSGLVKYGSTIIYPTDIPSYYGYTFVGWDCNLNTMPAYDLTINALYTANTYTLTFMSRNTVISSEPVKYGSTIIYPTDVPSYYGYTFIGWDCNLTTMPASDLIINALYIVNTGDSEGEEGEIVPSLTISTASAQSDWYKTVLADYNAKRKAAGKSEIKFEYVVHEENVVQHEVADWTEGPDVYAFVGDQMSTLYKKQALAIVPTEYQATMKENDGENEINTYASYVNKVVGYPYAADNGYFLYYDKDILSEEDVKTWDGIMTKATESRKFGYDIGNAWYSMGALFTFGADYKVKFTKQGNISSVDADFNTEKGLKAAKFIKKVYQAQLDKKVCLTVAGAPNANNAMCACIDGSHNFAAYKKSMGARLGCAKLPTVTVDNETKTIGSFLSYKLFGVNNAKKDAAKIALSHEVAQYLTSVEVQQKRFEDFGIMPSNKTLAASEVVQRDPHVLAIQAQVAAGASHPQTTVPSNCWDAPNTFTTELSEQLTADREIGSDTIGDVWLSDRLETMNEAIMASR